MTNPSRLLLVTLAASMLFACAKKEEPAAKPTGELTTEEQKFGYAIGVNLGNSLQPVSKHVDYAALKQGLDDVASGATLKLNDEEREAIHNTMAQKIQDEQKQEREAQAGKAKEDGEKFLAENGKRPEVKTTASGLQYEVITEGEGTAPKASDTVTVNYRGTLINGEEFDSSYERGQPATFPLANVIPGWTEGLQLMKPGAKYKLYLPPSLAYGERGAGVKIGPNSTLVFEVELISVGPGEAEGEAHDH